MDTMFRMNLCLFGEGAAAGASAGGEAGGNASGSNAGFAAQKTQPEKVVYGIQDAEETVADTETQAEETKTNDAQQKKSDPVDKGKAFEDMIKGDYKEQFDARVKQILEKRFKEHGELEKFKTDSQEILDLMYAKYGVKDLKSLQKAVQEDDSYFEEAAEAENLTVDQYKYKMKLEKENAEKDKALKEIERRENVKRIYGEWQRQADSLKAVYPNFSLEKEIENPQFGKLLQGGVDVKAAFEAIHHDEILSGAMMKTANAVRKNVTDNIKARGLRPSENGINAQAGVIVKNDVSKLTPKDRAEIARRARMGETIKF